MLRNSEIKVFSCAYGRFKEVFEECKLGMLPFADENSCNEKSSNKSHN